jgi:hypothetical protein
MMIAKHRKTVIRDTQEMGKDGERRVNAWQHAQRNMPERRRGITWGWRERWDLIQSDSTFISLDVYGFNFPNFALQMEPLGSALNDVIFTSSLINSYEMHVCKFRVVWSWRT